MEENPLIWAVVDPCKPGSTDSATSTMSGFKAKRKPQLLRHVRGKVAEWIDQDNLTVGGGWEHNVKYILRHHTTTVVGPSNSVGLRCVCTWEKIEN